MYDKLIQSTPNWMDIYDICYIYTQHFHPNQNPTLLKGGFLVYYSLLSEANTGHKHNKMFC